MANDTAETETAATAGTAKTAKATEARSEGKGKKYSIESLERNRLQLFGVSASVFAGATAGLEGKYTIKEMEGIIKKWCGEEIKQNRKEAN